MKRTFTTLSEFYPYYLGEHRQGACRLCHLVGSCAVVATLALLTISSAWQWVWVLLPMGYGPAWLGHFFFEKNRPATFRYPIKSFLCDWWMVMDMIRGKIPMTGTLPDALCETL